MGATSSRKDSVVGGSSTSVCCGKRGHVFVVCRNDRLNSWLDQLSKQGKEFDSAWLYREEMALIPHMDHHQYILLYQRHEIKDGADGEWPDSVRRHLRLDWGRDGLSFMEVDRRLPEELLVRSKVFEPALKPAELLQELELVQTRSFDVESWNSSNFCFHMIEQAGGQEYEYR
mmetsp:Transcript_37755/g.85166  ORF Transcript_37755/g.85166 Transcript_37755/m.85166 type:complete len:173 (-) Transcript_37755:175-693(-)